jgi:hypothetical protein
MTSPEALVRSRALGPPPFRYPFNAAGHSRALARAIAEAISEKGQPDRLALLEALLSEGAKREEGAPERSRDAFAASVA